MNTHTQLDTTSDSVAVIGAGIVGVSCALWLQRKGYSVTLIDGCTPGSGTSSGNACTIANYACIPVNDPNIVFQLPYYLFNQESPLRLDPLYALTHMRWMFQFLKHCKKSRVDKIVRSLALLLEGVDEGLDPLIKETGTQDLFLKNGCLYLYETLEGFEKSKDKNETRAKQGVSFRTVDTADIKALEPGISKLFAKGLFYENARQVVNPLTLVTRYFDHFCKSGGEYLAQNALNLKLHSDKVLINLSNQQTVSTRKVVICSGAFSKSISGAGIKKLPLDTERGYHIQYNNLQNKLNRPVAWGDAGFYATPMDQGLRFAGTVELAGLKPKKSKHNIDYLIRKSKEMFDLPTEPNSDWLGYRPTMPDALPVIGVSDHSDAIYFAFGHQHIGLTLAGITGKLISELLTDEKPSIDLFDFRADRF